MAEDAKAEEAAEQPKPKRMMLAVIIVAVGLVCAAIGFAVPILFPQITGAAVAKVEQPPQPAFVPFGDSVANLNEGSLTRYLRIKITLQVDEDLFEEITKRVEKKKPILKSWLLKYLSGQTMDDIRGTAGQNRLRREIQDRFNDELFTDGYDEIKDVLFEEFSIQ